MTKPKFLSAESVCDRYDRGRMWLYRILKRDPKFPRPVIIGNRRYWHRTELEEWETGLPSAGLPAPTRSSNAA